MWLTAMALDGLAASIEEGSCVGIDGRRYELRRWRRYVRPSDVGRLAPHALLVCNRATRPALERLSDLDRAWAISDGRYRIPRLGERWTPIGPDPVTERSPAPILARLALLIAMQPNRTHREYAQLLGVTRSRATQLVDNLKRTHGGATSEQLLEVWWGAHPSPSGPTLRLFSDAPLWRQADHAYRWLEGLEGQPALGAELAADVYAPWATPRRAFIHSRAVGAPPDGFVPADRPGTETLTVLVDDDASIAGLAQVHDSPAGRLRLVHPVHAAADLLEVAEEDRVREQLDVLRRLMTPRGGVRA